MTGIPALVLVVAISMIVALSNLSGCGNSVADGTAGGINTTANGANTTAGSLNLKLRLELLEVDEELSQKVQAKVPEFTAPPAGKTLIKSFKRDPAGNIQRDYYGEPLSIPWIVKQTPIVTYEDVSQVINPGTDSQGRPYVVIRLNDEGTQKLAVATRQIYTTAMATGKIKKMAIVIDDEVKAVISLASPIEDGEIRFTCTSQEALDIEAQFS